MNKGRRYQEYRKSGMTFNRTENARTKINGNSYPTPGQLLPFEISTEIRVLW
jgi:hypothetical protein